MLGGEGGHSNNVIREVDLAGDPIRETNMASVNAQLVAKGYRRILGFHHDAIRLPNGDTAVLGYEMRRVPGAGAHGDNNVIGDILIVLDTNWQVAWAWDAFDNLPYRPPVLGETCFVNYLTLCPVPDPRATDWLHTNAISYSPADGNLTLSLRDQDWVIKLAYQNGAGDGHVIWRLGRGGDFRLGAGDPSLWFSHQHDAHYLDNTTIGLFDNGNTRCHNAPKPCDSRGQILTVDEQNMVVTPTVSADMGAYSDVFGSAERLANGNFAFTSGYQIPGPTADANEVNPSGTRVYSQQLVTDVYRGYRFKSLYSASLTSS
jgi:hypothetical protein